MDEIHILRERAKSNRDEAIAKAKSDYKQAMAHIDGLSKVMPVAPRSSEGKPTLRQAIAAAITDKPRTTLEIAVAVIESGYRSRMSRREIVKRVARILREDQRFKRDGNRWVVTHDKFIAGS